MPKGEKKKKILIVEDDQTAREALQTLLERQNFRVLTASNGLAASEVFEQYGSPISLVISDIVMPEMGGIPLFRNLRKNHPLIRFLFITGHPLDSDTQKLLEEGHYHWLQKPFSVRELSSSISEVLYDT